MTDTSPEEDGTSSKSLSLSYNMNRKRYMTCLLDILNKNNTVKRVFVLKNRVLTCH